MKTSIKPFPELTVNELYTLLRLRNEVFVVEQNCVYQDVDGKDPQCHHLMLMNGEDLIAYARLVPAGLSFDEVSIGRVISSPAARGTGAGRILMQTAIEACGMLYGNSPIKIGAQAYLVKFYASLGFVQVSDAYDEDGIPHMDMLRQP